MASITDITGLVGVASAMAASLRLLPGAKRPDDLFWIWATRTVFVVALLPFNDFPLAAFVRGATGDLSITTLALLWCALLRPWVGCLTSESRSRPMLLALIALAAVVFYPMALGLGAFDPYRLGYANGWFVAALSLITLAAWFWKHYLVVLCISLAVLAWAVGWYESRNLWDYLLDPFVSIYALSVVFVRAARNLKKPQAPS